MHKISLKSIIFIYILQIVSISFAAQVKTRQLGTLGGSQPELIHRLCNDFIAKKDAKIKSFVLLLHGPSGNGKTTIAEEFAKVAHAQFNYCSGPNIVTPFQGSGVENVKEIFERAKKSNDNQVIFIDEFDAIARTNTHTQYNEHQLAYQQFNIELDKIKNNPKIFVICATNFFDKISEEIKRRFNGHTCEIGNPNKADRENIISKRLLQYNAVEFDIENIKKIINRIDKQANGINLAVHFEKIISSLQEIATLNSSNLSLTEIQKQTISHIDNITASLNALILFSPLNTDLKEFKIHIDSIVNQLKIYAEKIGAFNTKILAHVVNKTDGICIDYCRKIYEKIQVKINEDGITQITIEELNTIIEPYTKEVQEKAAKKAQELEEQKKAKERQDIDDQNRKMTNKATKASLVTSGAVAGGIVGGGITAGAASVVASQTLTVASPLVAKAALAKAAAAAMAAGKPVLAKTIAAKAASITVAKAGSITVAKGLAGKIALAATVPGANIVIIGVCMGAGAYGAYKYFIE